MKEPDIKLMGSGKRKYRNSESIGSKKQLMRLMLSVVMLILCSAVLTAQSRILEGTVLSKTDGSPVVYCTVKLSNQALGTISGMEGKFRLQLPDHYQDSIVFRHIGFIEERFSITALQKQSTVLLKEDTLSLGQVTIISTGPVNARQTALEAIAQYHKKKNKEAHISSTYSNEIALIGTDTVFRMDALGYSVFAGVDAPMTDLAQHKFFYDNIWIHKSTKQWEALAPKALGYSKPAVSSGNTYNLLRYTESRGLLDSTTAKSFKYKFVNQESLSIAYKGKNSSGIMHLNTIGQIESIEMTKAKRIWSNVFNERVTGTATIRFAYYDDAPYADEISIAYKKGSIRHGFLIKTLLQKTDEIEITPRDLGTLNVHDFDPLVRFDEEQWFLFNLKKPNARSVAYMKSIEGKHYLSDKSPDIDDIYKKINVLKDILFR
ncbi:MAG: hypothetical protein Roseis2KO_01560 [Roseivirga sp.]